MNEDSVAYLFQKKMQQTQKKNKFSYKIHEESKRLYQAHIIAKSFFYISRNCMNVIKLSLSTIAVVWLGAFFFTFLETI